MGNSSVLHLPAPIWFAVGWRRRPGIVHLAVDVHHDGKFYDHLGYVNNGAVSIDDNRDDN